MKQDQPIVLASSGGFIHNVLGSPYRFLMTSADTGGAFALLEVTAPPQSADIAVPAYFQNIALDLPSEANALDTCTGVK